MIKRCRNIRHHGNEIRCLDKPVRLVSRGYRADAGKSEIFTPSSIHSRVFVRTSSHHTTTTTPNPHTPHTYFPLLYRLLPSLYPLEEDGRWTCTCHNYPHQQICCSRISFLVPHFYTYSTPAWWYTPWKSSYWTMTWRKYPFWTYHYNGIPNVHH